MIIVIIMSLYFQYVQEALASHKNNTEEDISKTVKEYL